MEKKINIHSVGETVNLKTGSCKIDIIGGWGVHLGSFSIILENTRDGKIIKCKRVLLGIQSWNYYNKRSKRIFKADILNSSQYVVQFFNSEEVVVRPSNLILLSLIQKPLKNESLEIGLSN